jgi:ferredoxin
MAIKEEKWKDNVEGKFYVDSHCIACEACVQEAQNFFAMNMIAGHAHVYRQPSNEKEIALCKEAQLLCPVEAIGNDGN